MTMIANGNRRTAHYQVVADEAGALKGQAGLLFHGLEMARMQAQTLANLRRCRTHVVENKMSGAHGTRANVLATFDPQPVQHD